MSGPLASCVNVPITKWKGKCRGGGGQPRYCGTSYLGINETVSGAGSKGHKRLAVY
jgi:hypothetical protein